MMDDSGNNNAIIKITSVTTTGFCAKVMETIFEDGPHVNVPAYYVAIPVGVYRLPDGTKVEAGVKDISNVVNDDRTANTWTTLSFSHAYSQPPSVITQLQTLNNELPSGTVSTTARGTTNNAISIPWVTETVQNITSSSAQIALDKSHIIEANLYVTKPERVGYFIIESNKLGTFTASDNNPVTYQTFLTGNVFGGYDQACSTINIDTAFPSNNYLFIASKAVNNPSYGGWLRKCAETGRKIGLEIDSKRMSGSGKISGTKWVYTTTPNYGLSTRNHPAAPASIAVFSRAFDLSRTVNDANLSISAAVSASSVFASDPVSIDINVSNKGPDSAPNTTVSLSLPSGMSFQQITSGGSSWNCAQNGTGVDCNLISGSLSANTYSNLKLLFSAPATEQSYTVNLSATSDGLDDDGASASVGFSVINLLVDDDKAECPTASFTTISGALTAVTPGKTIQVCKGTYTENVVINVNDINITSQSGTSSDVVVRGSNSNAFTINKTNVGIKNLSIVQNVSNSRAVLADNASNLLLDNLVISYTNGSNEAIKLQNGSTTPNLKNLTITSDQSGIKMDGANGFTLSNLTVTAGNNGGNYGIYGWNINVASSLSQIKVQSGDNAVYVVSGQKTTMLDINATSSAARAVYIQNGTFSLGVSAWTSNNLAAQLIALQGDNAGAFSVQNTNASSTADTVMKFGNVGSGTFTFTDNNIIGNSANSYGVYIDGGGSASIIQRNIIQNATTNKGLRLMNNPTFSSKISNNCFMNNATHNAGVDNNGNSQFNGNFWGTTAGVSVTPDYTDTAALSYCPLTSTPVLIADYHFDECLWNGTSNEVVDSTGNGFNATALNSLNTVSSGKLCRGTTFNGTDQYVSAPGIATYLQNTASLSFWIKTTQAGNNTDWQAPGITGVEQSGGLDDIFWGWIDASGKIGLNAKGDGTQAKSTIAVNDGTWRHVVLTRNAASGALQIYINGVLNASGTGGTGTIGTSFSSIGKIEDTGGTPTYFNGSLDEIKIFDRVLSGSDIAAIYANESASKNYDGSTRTCIECSPPPMAEYRFDECSWNGASDEILDSSGNNYHATLFNTGASTEDYANAQGGICRVSKLGGNTYLQVSSTFPDFTSNFSITGWFNSSNIAKTGQRIFIDDQSNSRGYGLSVNDDGNRYVRFYDRSQPNSGVIDATAAPLVSNQWYFAAAVTDVTQSLRHLYVYDSTGTLLDHKTMSITGSIGTDSGPASMGGETNSGETGNRFQGYQDEIKVFDKALTPAQLSLITYYESRRLNFDGSSRTCSVCVTPPNPVYSFNAWDSFRSISDRNISTKIVGKPFDITIASLNETDDGYQDFNGTVCAQILNSSNQTLSGWNQLLFSDQNTSTTSFTISSAVGGSNYAKLKLSWKKNTVTTCPISGEDNSTIASDYFAIRPASFTLSAPNAIAGRNFDIIFSAPDFAAAASNDYNETAGNSFSVTLSEQNASCPLGTFTPDPKSFSFVNGTKTLTTRYNEAGRVDINVSDTSLPCGSRFTRIDCDDANVSGYYSSSSDLPIGAVHAQITIIPSYFDVNATLTNYDGGTFTYLSSDLNMSAELSMRLTARNDEGNTTLNYTSGCYARSTTVDLAHSSLPSALNKIFYYDTLDLSERNVSKSSAVPLSFGAGDFSQGVLDTTLYFNFDRNYAKPLNPFAFTFSSANALDADGVSGSTAPLGSSEFVFGRVHAYDVATNEASAPNPVEFEIYSTSSTGFVSGMPQNVLHWYRNTDHTSHSQGEVLRGGFTAGSSDPDVTAGGIGNGTQNVTVTSDIDRTVHLDISKWLWYSPLYGYDYSGDCSRHPCFLFDHTDASATPKGVSSGNFNGSDFQTPPAENITNKGIKLFR